MLLGMEIMSCPNLAVPKDVMHHVVRVESSYNPYAIGVVGGRLARQPRTLPEALATVRMLEAKGYNFSLGLAQVNRYNLGKYGIGSYEQAFDICPNLQTGSRILAECYSRSGGDWGKSFSCYYSGNFVTGYRHGYVQKIYASMRGKPSPNPATTSPDGAISVVGKPSRRVVGITRFPIHAPQRRDSRLAQASYAASKPVRIEVVQPLAQQQAAAVVLPNQTLGPTTGVALDAVPQTLSAAGPLGRQSETAVDDAFVF